MTYHQKKTLKKPKDQSRSRKKPTKKKEKEIQRIEVNLQIYKKIKRSKAEVRDDALQKKKKNSKVQGRSRSEPIKKEQVQGRSLSRSPTKKIINSQGRIPKSEFEPK